MDDAPQDAGAPPVNDADLRQAAGVRFVDVLLDDRLDLARPERVEIERAVDGQDERLAVAHAFVYVAVTDVRIPPRGVKSPTTVMRLGRHAATRSSRIWFVAA